MKTTLTGEFGIYNKILIIWLDGELGLICEFVGVVSKSLVIYIVHSRTFFFFFFSPSLQPPPPCLCELLMISHVSQMAKCFWDHFQNHNETQLKTSHFSTNLYILHRKHFPPRPTECKFVLLRQFNGNWFHPHYHLLLQHHCTPIL